MHAHATFPFEFIGDYGGFVFTDEGKRRLRLRVGENEYLLKAPKGLRRRIVANFRPGQAIRVTGSEERDTFSGASKWLIAELLPADGQAPHQRPPSAVTGPIRVCSKKNCWRKGGSELWQFLERESDARGLGDTLNIKAVDCLDYCKKAPNIQWQGQIHTHCTLADAEAIIDQAEAGLRAEAVSGRTSS